MDTRINSSRHSVYWCCYKKIIFSFIYCDITIVLELQKVKHDKVIFNWTFCILLIAIVANLVVGKFGLSTWWYDFGLNFLREDFL